MGYARGVITANLADVVVIMVGGRVGSLIEASSAYLKGKPIVALRGIAEKSAGKHLDERELVRARLKPTLG